MGTAESGVHLEMGLGWAKAATQGDGIWYQQGLPHRMNLDAPVKLIGLTGNWSAHWRWHLDAVDLGSYSVDSWDTARDNYYSLASKTCLQDCNRLAHFLGDGHVYGLAAPVEWHTAGAWEFGVSAGPFVYHSAWSVQVPNFAWATRFPQAWTPQTAAPFAWTPGGLARAKAGWKLGYVLGASITHAQWTFGLSYYHDGAGFPLGHGAGYDGWPPLWSSQTVLLVSRTF